MKIERPLILPDTNVLMQLKTPLHELDWGFKCVDLLLSKIVVSEIGGLTNNADVETAEQAQKAQKILKKLEYDKNHGIFEYQQGKVHLKRVLRPQPSQIPPTLKQKKPDHQLIATALAYQMQDPVRFCVLVTHDREMCHIATMLSVPNVLLYVGREWEDVQNELQVKREWWQKLHHESLPLPHKRLLLTDEQRSKRFDWQVQQLYRQIRAERHRLVLSVAQRRLRIELAAKVVEKVNSPMRRIVVVAVANGIQAEVWTQELRTLTGFSAEDIVQFDPKVDYPPRTTRAMICSYEQLVWELPAYFGQLKKHRQLITAIVDGCDLIAPADLAPIIFDSDQFVGFSRSFSRDPATSMQRMLKAFSHGNRMPRFTLVDAEVASWGHPIQLRTHRVHLNGIERQCYDEANRELIKLREQVIAAHSELGDERKNFWESLYHVLAREVLADEAELLKLREESERLTVQATYKGDLVEQLFANSAEKEPHRSLIFDYRQKWTVGLRHRLKALGILAAELRPSVQEWGSWHRFVEQELDVLLLSHVPENPLPPADIRRVVIMTPQHPPHEINDLIDWVLENTLSKDAVQIDMLYVADSVEESVVGQLGHWAFSQHYPV